MYINTRSVTSQFMPITLNELNQVAALQTRADNKYFVPIEPYFRFISALRATHRILEIDGQRAFQYDTQYFDTPTFDNYWSHIQKRRKRYKCRSRLYANGDLCVFELKLKSGRGETVKSKIPYDKATLREVTPEANIFLQSQLQQAYGVASPEELIPSLRTRYERVTLVSDTSPERITCDFNLVFSTAEDPQGSMNPDVVLVEIKSARGRSDADQLLWRLGVRPTSGSKYCVGLSLVYPHLRDNPFRRVSDTYFSRIAA
jgi:hypothetical protein